MMLFKIIILFLCFVLFYILFLGYSQNANIIKEGYQGEYQPYDENVMILAQKNAGNIEVLRERLDGLSGVKGQLTDLSNNVTQLQEDIATLMEQQQSFATDLTGGEEADISGAVEDTTLVEEDEETDIQEGFAKISKNYLLY